MPAALEHCVASMMQKWREKPESQPANVKGKDEKEKRSHAFAICTAAMKHNWEEDESAIQLQMSGHGPVLAGIGLTNRPFLKGLPPISIVEENGEQRIRVPFFRFGRFRHPKAPEGKLVFTPEFLTALQENFKHNVYGQKVLLDKAHKPDAGNMGELERIEQEGDIGSGYFIPTPAGLEAVRQREYLYGSMDFFLNWEGNEVSMSYSDEDFEEIALTNQVLEGHFELFNPYHDDEGKFASSGAGAKLKKVAPIVKSAVAGTVRVAAFTGGAVVGSNWGYRLAKTSGLGGAAVFIGTALGAVVGAAAGEAVGKKITGLSELELAEADNEKLLEMLRVFVADDEAPPRLCWDADENPGLDKYGLKFNKEYNVFYLDKDDAKKVLAYYEKKEAKQMGEKSEVVTLSKKEYEQLAGASTKLVELESNQAMMLAEIRRQKAELYHRDVETFIERSSLPVDGKSFSKPVLEVVQALLLNAPTGESKNIQLSDESRGNVESIVKYFHDGVRYLLSLIPRDVLVKAPIQGRDQRPPDGASLSEQAERETTELAAFVLGVEPKKDKEVK